MKHKFGIISKCNNNMKPLTYYTDGSEKDFDWFIDHCIRLGRGSGLSKLLWAKLVNLETGEILKSYSVADEKNVMKCTGCNSKIKLHDYIISYSSDNLGEIDKLICPVCSKQHQYTLRKTNEIETD